MKQKNTAIVFGAFIVTLLMSSFLVYADVNEAENEVKVLGIDLDEIIVMGSSLLAVFLFIFASIAYRRDGRKILLYVAAAFFLFALKGALLSVDVFFPGKGLWADPLANFLDFAILLSFFFGIVKRRG
jgi:hypothetical protein